ncbi:MAG: hypothetical protein Q7S12_02450 [bacterium]|nr:hypothetical protein [bacterium]
MNFDQPSVQEPQQESQEKKPTLHTPNYEVLLTEFGKKHPEKIETIRTVLDEFDEQGIKNFSIFRSEAMPGVAFSHTKLTITTELINKLSKNSAVAETEMATKKEIEGKEENTNAKRQDYFLFGAFAFPPEGGNAFGVEDLAIDRFIRLLPRVAGPIKRGEVPPEVNVHLLGAPTGFGGAVNEKWIENIEKNGLDGHAKLYAEFISRQEPADGKDVHVVLQGVSKGAIIAEKTSKYLPEELQKNTQRLLDNPAGEHKKQGVTKWLKGTQIAGAMIGETISRILLDSTMRNLMKFGGPFIEKLSKETGIPTDNDEQKKLKLKATMGEALALLKGSPMDTENTRSFIRRGIYDPLTFTPKRLLEIWQKDNKKNGTFPFFQKGKSLEVPFKSPGHFFIYDRFERWNKILGYSEKAGEKKNSA